MTITDAYNQYKIMPQLRLHQLRVAAVAAQLCRALKVPVDSGSVIRAGLLHDMGNILKFDLTYFPESVQSEGLEYWEQVKTETAHRYGPDEHAASLSIARELGATPAILDCIANTGFTNVSRVLTHGTLEQQIGCYADMRVAPHGVVSIKDRLADGRKRYAHRQDHAVAAQKYDQLTRDLHKLEQKLFEQASIALADISDASIKPALPALQELAI